MSPKRFERGGKQSRLASKLAHELNQELREGKNPDEIEDPLIRSIAEDQTGSANIDPDTFRLHPTAIENPVEHDMEHQWEDRPPIMPEISLNPVKNVTNLARFIIKQVHKPEG